MSIKIQRRGWIETFTYREAVFFLKSLAPETLTDYWIDDNEKQQNGAKFLENYEESKMIESTNQHLVNNHLLFKITQNEEGTLFFNNNEITIPLNRTQFQKLSQNDYVQKLEINIPKAIQYYQNQLF